MLHRSLHNLSEWNGSSYLARGFLPVRNRIWPETFGPSKVSQAKKKPALSRKFRESESHLLQKLGGSLFCALDVVAEVFGHAALFVARTEMQYFYRAFFVHNFSKDIVTCLYESSHDVCL